MRWFNLVSAALIAFFASAAGAQTTDAGALYRQFQEAINRGDADEAIALLADDASWLRDPACRPACMGKARIRQEIQRQIGDHNATSAFTWEAKGSAVVVRFEHRSDFTRKRGFERRIQLDTVTARDGKIGSIESGLDMSDPQTAAFAAAPAP